MTERLRDAKHLAWLREQPCTCCGRPSTHAHHIMVAQPSALSLKSGDDWAVPLCFRHHENLHRVGDERLFWAVWGVDAEKKARELFDEYRSQRGDAPA